MEFSKYYKVRPGYTESAIVSVYDATIVGSTGPVGRFWDDIFVPCEANDRDRLFLCQKGMPGRVWWSALGNKWNFEPFPHVGLYYRLRDKPKGPPCAISVRKDGQWGTSGSQWGNQPFASWSDIIEECAPDDIRAFMCLDGMDLSWDGSELKVVNEGWV